MDPIGLIVAVGFGAVAFVVIWVAQSWATKRFAKRLISDALALANKRSDRPSKLIPESQFVVEISQDGVCCSRPDGTSESVKWEDLQKVEILTTDAGPFAPDVFWVLYGSTDGCVIPWGATGEKELMNRLQALPEFRNDVIVDAASLTTNNQLVCWKRTHQDA